MHHHLQYICITLILIMKTPQAHQWTPSPIREITPPPEKGEEMNISHAIVNIPSEKHCSNNSVVLEHEGPSSYNIE